MGAPLVTDTTATFEDVDGDGVDDDCQEAALENTEAATAAFEAADLNDDGMISVTEAAQSGWTGGSELQPRRLREPGCPGRRRGDRRGDRGRRGGRREACEEVAAPEPETPLDPTAPNSHGAWVSWVAGSEATGGKNCNHGGAVSEAAKKDHEGAKAERDATKAERDAKKAEQKAARDARKAERAAERAAAKAAKSQGHGKPN